MGRAFLVGILSAVGTQGGLKVYLNAAANPGHPEDALPGDPVTWTNIAPVAEGGIGGAYSYMPDNGGANHLNQWPERISGRAGEVVFYSAAGERDAGGAWGRAQAGGFAGFVGPSGDEPQLQLGSFSFEIWLRRLGFSDVEGQIAALAGASGSDPTNRVDQIFMLFTQADRGDPNDGLEELDILIRGSFDTGISQSIDVLPLPVTADFDQWVFTWNNGSKQCRIYRNAVLASTVSFPDVTFTSSTIMDNNSFFKSGAENSDARVLNGDITVVRIYDEVIGQATIDANFALGPGAGITVPGPPITEAGFVQETGFEFSSVNGQNYRLERTTDELNGVWTKVPHVVEGTGGTMTVFDPAGYSSDMTYRLLPIP
jgi:hypothetical protein